MTPRLVVALLLCGFGGCDDYRSAHREETYLSIPSHDLILKIEGRPGLGVLHLEPGDSFEASVDVLVRVSLSEVSVGSAVIPTGASHIHVRSDGSIRYVYDERQVSHLQLRHRYLTSKERELHALLATEGLLQQGSAGSLRGDISAAFILHPAESKDALNRTMVPQPTWLGDVPPRPNRLLYSWSETQGISFETIAEYGTLTPAPKLAGPSLDFSTLAAVNFGMRGYLFNEALEAAAEWGEYGTTALAVAADPVRNLFAFSFGSRYRVDLVDGGTLTKVGEIASFLTRALAFHDGWLYFAGHNEVSEPDAALHRHELSSGITEVVGDSHYVSPRGLTIVGDRGYISDTVNHRILEVEVSTGRMLREARGFHYPAGLDVTPRGTLIVADEHNNAIQELSITDFTLVRSVGVGQLYSPGSVREITTGQHTGAWLISDSDHDRVILVWADPWELLFQISNLPDVVHAVSIHSTQD